MLAKAVHDMDTLQAQARAKQLRQSLGVALAQDSGPRSVWELAATMTEDELQLLEVSTQEMQQQLGIAIDKGPRAATQQAIAARKAGHGDTVDKMLKDRELQLRMSQHRGRVSHRLQRDLERGTSTPQESSATRRRRLCRRIPQSTCVGG